jgi:hypothetical protein
VLPSAATGTIVAIQKGVYDKPLNINTLVAIIAKQYTRSKQ